MVPYEKIFRLGERYTLAELTSAYLTRLKDTVKRLKAAGWKNIEMQANLFRKINEAFNELYRNREPEEITINERTRAAEALSRRAKNFYYKNDYWAAAELFQQAITLDGSRHTYFGFLGLCFLKLEKYEAAIKSFEKAIELYPASSDYWYNLGIAYYKAGIKSRAIEKLVAAFLIEPKDEKIIRMLRATAPEIFKEEEPGILKMIKKLFGGKD